MNKVRNILEGRIPLRREYSIQGPPGSLGFLSKLPLVYRLQVTTKNLFKGLNILLHKALPKRLKYQLLVL